MSGEDSVGSETGEIPRHHIIRRKRAVKNSVTNRKVSNSGNVVQVSQQTSNLDAAGQKETIAEFKGHLQAPDVVQVPADSGQFYAKEMDPQFCSGTIVPYNTANRYQ